MTDERKPFERDSALLIVDVQNDFCTGGALAVPESERVVAALNRYISHAAAGGLPIYASRDWHPANTSHFADHGGTWPVHCVENTHGARFHRDLRLPSNAIVVTKGVDPDRHGYSAFEGHTADGPGLAEDLRQRGVTHVYVGGLATDYCVRQTALDALAHGLRVTVLEDAIAGVDLKAGDSARALHELREKGATITAPGATVE